MIIQQEINYLEDLITQSLKLKPLFFVQIKRSSLEQFPNIDRTLVFRVLSQLISDNKVSFTSYGALILNSHS